MASYESNIPLRDKLSDTELASGIMQTGVSCVVLVHADYRTILMLEHETGNVAACRGEIGKQADEALRKRAKAGSLKLLAAEQLAEPIQMDPDWVTQASSASVTDFKSWYKGFKALFGSGRGEGLTDKGKVAVWHSAAGRCMFRGCAIDLTQTSLTDKTAPHGYLAHIVAADPRGPRGGQERSHLLAGDPNNVMLLCDEHHRLIDRIAIDEHPETVLRDMRDEHAARVRQVLDTLKHPVAKALAFLGDIGQVTTGYAPGDMRMAIIERKLCPPHEIAQLLRLTDRDNRLDPLLWYRLLHELEPNIQELVRMLKGLQPLGDQAPALAVFPLHRMPMLILAGRIVGEGRPVEVFQFHRRPGVNSWRWPADAIPAPTGAFWADLPSAAEQRDEVLVTVELTDTVQSNDLPAGLAERVSSGSVPWVRVRTLNPGINVIGHPDDLVQFTTTARQAIACVQDKLRAREIHLVCKSPVSPLFRFGQLLQAAIHPICHVYDRQDRDQPYTRAITIDRYRVFSAGPSDQQKYEVPLR